MQQTSPAAARNEAYIFEVLSPYLPQGAQVLEVASGTGQHAVAISRGRPDITWQPSDVDPVALASIKAWKEEEAKQRSTLNLRDPVYLNICDEKVWPIEAPVDAIVNINMLHISPWTAGQSLMAKAPHYLKKQGYLYFYGPFLQADKPTAPSNLEFDRSLKMRDPRWGLRDLDSVRKEAEKNGFRWLQTVDMPAHNLSVIFQLIP